MSDAPQTRTDSLTPPPNGRSLDVEALTAALAEARLKQALLEQVIAQVPVGVFVADAKTGLPQLVNQAGIDLLGRGLDPHRPKDEAAEVYPNYLPGTQQLYPVQDLPLVRTMSTGEPAQVEMDIQRPEGRVRVEMTTTPVRDAAGRVVSAVALIQPVTRRPAAETHTPEVKDEQPFQASLLAAQNEASREGILIVTADGQKILHFNQRFAELWQLPQEVIETRVDSDVLQHVARQIANVEEFRARVQYLYQHPDESSRDEIYLNDGRVIDRYTGPMKVGDNVYARVWFFHDVTEQKQAETTLAQRARDLEEATTFLDSVIENLPTMLFVKEAHNLRFVRWNKAGEELLGFPREAMVGKNDHDFFPKEEADFFTAKDREVLLGKQLVDIPEEPIQTAHRGLRLLHTRKIPILDAQGQPKYLLGISEDITERRQIEEALRRQQAQLTQALQIAKLGYWEYKPEHDQFVFNDQFYALFHTTAEQEGGYTMSLARYAERFVYPDDLPVVSAEIEKGMQSTDRHYRRELDHRINYADGGVGYLSVSINVERDERGHLLRYYGANQDITANKLAESASVKQAAELEVVAQVGTAAATILDPGQLLQTVVDLTKSNFKLYHAHVYLLNETGDTLELAAGAGDVGHKMVSQGWRILVNREQSLVARAARTRQGVIANDVRLTPEFLPNPLLPNTRSEMALPIIASDRVLGVLDVQADEVNHFTQEDLRTQSILVTQIAVALQNARQFAEARRLADRETLVNTISQQIQNATTVESALQIAARELGRALGAQRTVVQLGQSDRSPR